MHTIAQGLTRRGLLLMMGLLAGSCGAALAQSARVAGPDGLLALYQGNRNAGVANYVTPVCQELRMTSKAALLEASNPFMHLAKKTRQPGHFALFAAVYTL